MDLRGASLLVLCLLFKVSHQVSIGLVYSFYHFESNPVCRDIEPGVCCRALYTSRPYIVQQVSLMGVWFRGLEAMDLATAWGSTMTNWGCSGTVLDSALGAGYNYFEVQDPWLLNSPPMTGASYLRLSPASASMAFAQGIKAFLAGGAKAACSILGVDFKGHSKRDGQSPLTAPVKWMWPNMVTLNGSNYTEFGGIGSLRYRNDIGEELDFPELSKWNLDTHLAI